jgi:hypothetical protein
MLIHVTIKGMEVEDAAVTAAVKRIEEQPMTFWTELIGEQAIKLSPLKEPIGNVYVCDGNKPVYRG